MSASSPLRLRPVRALIARLLGISLALSLPLTASAADGTFNFQGTGGTPTTPASGNWGAAASWEDAEVPLSSPSTFLEFGGSGTGSYTATNNLTGDAGSSFVVGSIIFNSSSTGLLSLAGTPIAIDGSNAFIAQLGTGSVAVSNAIELVTYTQVEVASTGTLTFSGALSGDGALGKTGTGTLTLSGSSANELALLEVQAGTVELNQGGGASIGSFDIFDGATVKLQATGQISEFAGGRLNGTLDLNGYNVTLGSLLDDTAFDPDAPVTASLKLGSAQLTIDGGAFFGGVISGAGSLRIEADSFMVVTGANTYAGGTTIGGTIFAPGELMVSNTSGSGTGTGSITVTRFGILSGAGTIAPTGSNTVTVNGTLYPGDFDNDQLTFGTPGDTTTVTLGSNSLLLIEVCSCNEVNSIKIWGNLNILANATLSFDAGTLDGTYVLATYSSITGGSFAEVLFNGDTVSNPTAFGAFGGTHSLVYGATGLTIAPSAVPEPSTYAALAGIAVLGLAVYRRRRA
ncbi:MAG: PEP-CTERM sorting domain-containing protein [Verrucomicrobiota bacterium]